MREVSVVVSRSRMCDLGRDKHLVHVQSVGISLTTLKYDLESDDCVLMYRNELVYLKLDDLLPKDFLCPFHLAFFLTRDEEVMDMVMCQRSYVDISHAQGAISVQLLCASRLQSSVVHLPALRGEQESLVFV